MSRRAPKRALNTYATCGTIGLLVLLLGVPPAAAHDWDIAGAMAAGCAGALLLRPGTVANPLFPTPDIVEPDFERLTDRILASDREK